MDNTLLRNLKNKENQCRNLQKQADQVYINNGRNYSEDQCILLQRAADLESEMAGMTIGAESDHHVREKNRLDYDIMRIRSKLESAGISVILSEKGLGEYPQIRELYYQKI